MSEFVELPNTWAFAPLSSIADVNPRSFCPLPSAVSQPVHFVPMSAVTEEFGGIDISARRPLGDVQKGYTSFLTNDVLLAKITPCMENGKLALVPPLQDHLAFGSTEFHVLRAKDQVQPSWLAYFLSQSAFRRLARQNMTGSAGQLRVATTWLSDALIPVAPATEQTRIVAKLEELLSDLDAGVAELKAAQKKLAQYRQSLLKAAVEGALTAAWRTQHQPTETGAQLLQRILQERRARWEARQLAKFAEQGKTPPKDWQKKYPEPVQPDTTDLPELPQGWVWATAEMLFSWGSGDFLPASAQIDGDYPVYGGNGINGRHNAANVGHATIVIGRVGAHCGNVFRTESAAWVTDNAIYATAKNEFITWAHSELTMQAANLGSGSKGGAQPFISQKILNDTFIALPPIREQERILEEYVVALNSNEEMAASIAISLQQSTAQRQNILRAAFSGQLVPQDPHDEPASVLLERIRAERAAQGAVKKPRGRKAKEAA